MNDHERLLIDGLVHEASALLFETAAQRCGGATRALAVIREDPNGEGVWLDRFVGVFLREHALDTTAGACAVLEAFEARPALGFDGVRVGEALRGASAAVFGALVLAKTSEALERASAAEGVTA